MKKTVFIKIISLVLVLIMAMACAVSCNNAQEPDESSDTEASELTTDTESTTTDTENTTTDTEGSTTAGTESTETSKDTESEDTDADEPEVVEILPIIADKKTKYTIVTTDSVNADIAIATNELKCLFSTFAGVGINVKTVSDFKFLYGEKLNAPKIIVGSLIEDPESVNMRYALDSGEFIIKFSKNTLYITGKSNTDTLRAWEYFKITYLYKGMTELAFEDGFCYESKSEQVENITINGTPISEYKIVHCGSFHAAKYAEFIRGAIFRKTGITLGVTKDTSDETDHEILIGKTNRDESKAVRAEYERPNVYYDVKTLGTKLVVMGEGYKTLEHATAELEKYIGSITAATDVNGTIADGDVIDFIDTTTMIDRADGTDLRVLHYNMAAPLLWNENAIYKNDTERGEAIADMILAYYPDLVTTDEIYNSNVTAHHINLYKAVMGELYEYYYVLEDSPYDTDKPAEGVTGDTNYGINENILHKKSLGLELITSGWRYCSVKYDGAYVKYLGFHTAVFKMTDGQKFIISAGHYGDSGTDTTWAAEHQQAIADAQAASGSEEALPTIITGDMFTVKGKAGYKYHLERGFGDSQQSALIKCNISTYGDVIVSHATFHTVGVRQTSRAAEDFVWYSTAHFEALQFKVIASELTDRTSDHYPVCSDLKFK
ncbi:MAG: hypothetical protein IKL59_02900 [Clostridia bacterium]|nr:hypothetical protein [Clostridia bacterium]